MNISRHSLGFVALCLTIVAFLLVSLPGFAQQSPAPAGGQLQVRTASPSDAKDLTLDVVVTGAEFGHGRRAGILSDYTLRCAGRMASC